MKTLAHEAIDKSDLEILTIVDLEILRSIVKRKYKINIAVKDLEDKKKLLNTLNSLDDIQKSIKRSEENNKLVFKRSIKFLISKRKAEDPELKDKKKKEYETYICRQYFGGIPLPEVKKRKHAQQDPDLQEPSSKSGSTLNLEKADEKVRRFVINPNTINAKYIRFVFKSPEFKKYFDDFIDNLFIRDYQRSRKSKVLKIIDVIYSSLNQKKTKQVRVQTAKDYIEKNAKFKLPWTDKELRECLKSTKEFIGRVFRVRDDKRKRH